MTKQSDERYLDGSALSWRGACEHLNDFLLSVRGESSEQRFPFLDSFKQLSSLGASTSEIRGGIFISTSQEQLQDELLMFTTELRSESITLRRGQRREREREERKDDQATVGTLFEGFLHLFDFGVGESAENFVQKLSVATNSIHCFAQSVSYGDQKMRISDEGGGVKPLKKGLDMAKYFMKFP